LVTGQLLVGVFIFIRQPAYKKKLAVNNGVPVPEWRLPDVVVGGISFAAGISSCSDPAVYKWEGPATEAFLKTAEGDQSPLPSQGFLESSNVYWNSEDA